MCILHISNKHFVQIYTAQKSSLIRQDDQYYIISIYKRRNHIMNKRTLTGLTAFIFSLCIAGCSAGQTDGNETAENLTSVVSDTTEEPATETSESETTVPETTVTTLAETSVPATITDITVKIEEQTGMMNGITEPADSGNDEHAVKFTVIEEDGTVVEVTDSQETLDMIASLGELRRVGEENFGFIDIPADWDYESRYEIKGTEYLKFGDHDRLNEFTLSKSYDSALTFADSAYDSIEAAGYQVIQSKTTWMMGKKAYRIDFLTGLTDPYRTTYFVESGENECYTLQVRYTKPEVFKLVSTYDTEK